MRREFPIADSPSLRARADSWLSAPSPDGPVTPKRAATVMFVRDGAAGVEVFMLRRVASMEFAPRMMVFPGGGVDPRDADAGLPWAGPSAAEWASLLEVDEPTARVLVAAAVREVFEESGVLLAGPSADEVISDVSGEHWHEQRRRLLDREASLSEVLQEHGLLLRSDLLGYRAHWITPSSRCVATTPGSSARSCRRGRSPTTTPPRPTWPTGCARPSCSRPGGTGGR